jgi:hypothetical protein
MDAMNRLLSELLLWELLHAPAYQESGVRAQPLSPERGRPHSRVPALRHTLASALVWLGLRLDPSVRAALGAFDSPALQPEGRRRT